VNRREFITLFGSALAAAPGGAFAGTSKVFRLGTLSPIAPIVSTAGAGAILVSSLAQRGYTLGQNFGFEARGAVGDIGLLPQLMRELKAANVDVVVTIGYPTAIAAKESGVPTVVASGAGDPVATGLVASLARPGGSVTGISDNASELSTKRLSLLKNMMPQLRREESGDGRILATLAAIGRLKSTLSRHS
jgi:putative tryptophan/tyrosine transport system substrate-binding protein